MQTKFKKEKGFSILTESSFIYWGKRKGQPVIQLAKLQPWYLMKLHERSKFFRLSDTLLKEVRANLNWKDYLAK